MAKGAFAASLAKRCHLSLVSPLKVERIWCDLRLDTFRILATGITISVNAEGIGNGDTPTAPLHDAAQAAINHTRSRGANAAAPAVPIDGPVDPMVDANVDPDMEELNAYLVTWLAEVLEQYGEPDDLAQDVVADADLATHDPDFLDMNADFDE